MARIDYSIRTGRTPRDVLAVLKDEATHEPQVSLQAGHCFRQAVRVVNGLEDLKDLLEGRPPERRESAGSGGTRLGHTGPCLWVQRLSAFGLRP